MVAGFADLADGYLELDAAEPLSGALVRRVEEMCARIEDGADKGLSLLVHIRGAGPALGSWPGEIAVHLVTRWERALHRMQRLPTVVLAVVDGAVCTGPALDALLATDYRIAIGDVRFELSQCGGAAWPGMALYRLTTQAGAAVARRLLIGGADLTGTRAVELGVVDEVADLPGAVDRAREVLRSLTGLRGREFAVRRQLVLEAGATSFEDALGPHLAACDRALRLARQGLDAVSP